MSSRHVRVVRPVQRIAHPTIGSAPAVFVEPMQGMSWAQPRFGDCVTERPATICPCGGLTIEWYEMTAEERAVHDALLTNIDRAAAIARRLPWWAWIRRRRAADELGLAYGAMGKFWMELEGVKG